MKKLRALIATTAIAGINAAALVSTASVAKASSDYLPVFHIGNPDTAESTTNLTDNISNILNFGISILLVLAGGIAVLFLVWNGFLYITAGGDAAKAKTARAGIINAIIGIVVILAAYLIIRFATSIYGSLNSQVG
jgi:hypothetical protein